MPLIGSRSIRILALGIALVTAQPAAAAGDASEAAAALDRQVVQLHEQGRFAAALPLARAAISLREATLGPDHPDVAAGLNNLAALLRALGRHGEAEPLYRRSLAIWEAALGPDHPELLRRFNNLALLYADQGRYAEAEPLHRRSLASREVVLGPAHPEVATALHNLAGLLRAEGRHGEAEPLYRRSLAIREAAFGPEHAEVAASLNNLAQLFYEKGRLAEAEPLYRRSLAIRERALGPDHPGLANSLNNLATLLRAQRHYVEAEALHRRSLAIRESAFGPAHPAVAQSLNNLALLLRDQGRFDAAEPLYRRSLAIWEAALGPDHPEVALGLHNLALMLRAAGRPDEAVEHSRRGVALLARRFGAEPAARSGGPVAEQRARRRSFVAHVALVHEAAGAAGVAESFQTMQWAGASAAGRAVAGMAARFAAGGDALAEVMRERQDLTAHWERLDAALLRAVSQPPPRRDPAAEAELRAGLAATEKRLTVLGARLARDFPQAAEITSPLPLDLAEAQALLAPDEALLAYLAAGRETWLWAVRRDRATLHRLDIGADALAAEVTALRRRLDPVLNPELMPFEASRAHALHRRILAPADALLDGARHVFVVPDGALESLPIGVLVTEAPAAEPVDPADHRGVAWLARRHAVTVLPSVGALRALRQFAGRARATAPFLGIGDPLLDGSAGVARGIRPDRLYRGALADISAVRQLTALPETADELRAVARALHADERDLFLGRRATETAVRGASLDGFRVLHFATHGLVSGELQGLAEPALVLTPPTEATPEDDGLLTASEIATLRLNADWVVLSACNTAADDGTPDGGGLSGLARAFFHAGARSLLVSHWSVPSHAAVQLVTGAFAALGSDESIGRAEALRRAQLAMLDPARPDAFAHPLAWAPFVLVGEGAPGH